MVITIISTLGLVPTQGMTYYSNGPQRATTDRSGDRL